jgi:hypothetical protein
MSSVHTLSPYVFKLHDDINHASTPSLSFGLFPSDFPAKILCTSDVKCA